MGCQTVAEIQRQQQLRTPTCQTLQQPLQSQTCQTLQQPLLTPTCEKTVQPLRNPTWQPLRFHPVRLTIET